MLRGNLWLPSPATGKVPTVLTATGYTKDTTNPAGQACSGEGGIATAGAAAARLEPVPTADDAVDGERRGRTV